MLGNSSGYRRTLTTTMYYNYILNSHLTVNSFETSYLAVGSTEYLSSSKGFVEMLD